VVFECPKNFFWGAKIFLTRVSRKNFWSFPGFGNPCVNYKGVFGPGTRFPVVLFPQGNSRGRKKNFSPRPGNSPRGPGALDFRANPSLSAALKLVNDALRPLKSVFNSGTVIRATVNQCNSEQLFTIYDLKFTI